MNILSTFRMKMGVGSENFGDDHGTMATNPIMDKRLDGTAINKH